MNDVERKMKLTSLKLKEIKLLAQKIEVIKTNDLHHIQKSVDGINKILWAVSLLILAQLAMVIKSAVFG